VAKPGESEKHFIFRKGVFFLMTKNMPDSAVIYLHSAKGTGDPSVDDSITYYLAECYLALNRIEAALAANLSISDNSDFNVKNLFQRYRIFTACGMNDQASDLIKVILILHPDSEEASFLRSSFKTQKPSKNLSLLKPGMFLSVNEKKTSRNFIAGSKGDVNLQNFGEFGSQEWKTLIKAVFLLNFNISPSSSIYIHPWLKLSAPTQSFKDRYHYLALDINYMFAPVADKFHELTFTYIDKIKNTAISSHEFSIGWAFTHIGKNSKVFSNSISASYLLPDKNEKGDFYFSILLSQVPFISLGSRSKLDGWFLGIYSSSETFKSNIPASGLYGNGAVHGDLIGSAFLYTDSTFTDSVQMDLFLAAIMSQRLDGRVLGKHIPARFGTVRLGLDFAFHVKKWLSLSLKGQYETSFYVDTHRFDNVNNSLRNSNGEIYLFFNRSDNKEYLIYLMPKDSKSTPDVYGFKKYESVKKRRWDNTFLIRPGIDIIPVKWMKSKMYIGFARNVVSFIGDEKHSYTDNEFIPGFECSFRF
jgi:hypothetical protein